MSVRIYPDVNILLTLDFQQPILLRKCSLFANSIQKKNLKCYQLSTVKDVRDRIIKEINEAVGNALRGLWNHIGMSKGGGVPFLLEEKNLTLKDELGIRNFFHEKRTRQNRSLAKDEIQRQEVWAVEKLRDLLESKRQVSAMEYLMELSQRLSEQYVETRNDMLRTNAELNLVDEEEASPSQIEIEAIEGCLLPLGFEDHEDFVHLAALRRFKQDKHITPLFVTADRRLCECGPELYKEFGVAIEDALYAVGTYSSLLKEQNPNV